MAQYLTYFWSGPEGPMTLVIALVAMAALKVAGAAVIGRDRMTEADPLVGWAMLALLLTAANVVFDLPFKPLVWAFLAFATAGLFVLRKRKELPFERGAWKILVLALPLLLLVAAKGVSEWDEFSHWLATVKFMLATDAFPDRRTPTTGASFPAYPYNWPMLSYLVGRLAGHFVENASGVLNVLVLLCFGPVAVRMVCLGAEIERPPRWTWSMAALAVATVTILNPVWVQKVILTAYADSSSAVAVGFAGVLGWTLLGAIAAKDETKVRTLSWQMGMVLALLINIKQANLVLVVVVLSGIGLAALRDPDIRIRDAVRVLPAILLPPVLIYGIWRWHVTTEIPGREFGLLPFKDWAIGHVHQIVWLMATIAAKKTVYFGIMAVAAAFAVRGIVRWRGPFDRLAIIVGTAFVGYNVFLLFVYVASMGVGEGTRAASYWRYNMHLGLLAAAFAAYGLAMLWRRHLAHRGLPKWIVPALMVLVLAAPVALAPKLRFDLEMPKAHFLAVARAVSAHLPKGATIYVVDPTGSGESGIMVHYAIGRERTFKGWVSAFHSDKVKAIDALFENGPADFILVHSLVPDTKIAPRLGLKDGVSYLTKREANGTWSVVASWPYSGTK